MNYKQGNRSAGSCIVYDDVFSDRFLVPNRHPHHIVDIDIVAKEIKESVVDSIKKNFSGQEDFILLNSGGLESTLLALILKEYDINYTSVTLAPDYAEAPNSSVFLAFDNFKEIGIKEPQVIKITPREVSDSATYCNSIISNKNIKDVYDLVFWDLAIKKVSKENTPIIAGGFLRNVFNSLYKEYDNAEVFDKNFNDKLKMNFALQENNVRKINKVKGRIPPVITFPFHNPAVIKSFGKLDINVLQDNLYVSMVNALVGNDNIKIPIYHESPWVSLNIADMIFDLVNSRMKDSFNLRENVSCEEMVSRMWLNRFTVSKWEK